MDVVQGQRRAAVDNATLTSPVSSSPSTWAWGLGHAGLLPFAAGAVLMWVVPPETKPLAALVLVAYGALIASFLGGIHWGLAMRLPAAPLRLLLWGVAPSLLAWPALLMPPRAGLLVLGALLLVCYAVDRVLYNEQRVAAWLALRFRLSTVAALCCFIGAAGS
jgi:Protein of unknown function (DUF3429)